MREQKLINNRAMDKNTIEQFEKMAQMFKKAQTERKAFVLMPSIEGFTIHEVNKDIGTHAIVAQAAIERAEVEANTGENNALLPDVSNSVQNKPDWCTKDGDCTANFKCKDPEDDYCYFA